MEPEDSPSSTEAIRSKQVAHLRSLQGLSPRRPILVVHQQADPNGWHGFPCPHPERFWGCSILEIEIFLDWDYEEWSKNVQEAVKVQRWATPLGIEVESAFSGSKSIHQSIYFDPRSIDIPSDLRGLLELLRGDVAKIVRLVLVKIMEVEAGLDLQGLDMGKVRFGSGGKGSIKRIYGAPKKPGGRPKTWLLEIPAEKPIDAPLRFPPGAPKAFSLAPWADRILEALRAQGEARRADHTSEGDGALPARLTDLASLPWWKHVMHPVRHLHDASLCSLVLLCKDTDMAEEETLAFMRSWRPQGVCDTPSHQVDSTEWVARIRDLHRSGFHFSARRLQEALQDVGLVPQGPVESRAAFLGIEGKRAWRFPLKQGVVLVAEELPGRGWRFIPIRGDEEGAPWEVPQRTSRGVSALQSEHYRRQVLEAVLELLSEASLEDEERVRMQADIWKAFGELQKRERREEARVEQATQPPRKVLTAEEREEALDHLRLDDFLEKVVAAKLEGIGLVGEGKKGKALWLATLSRFSRSPVNINLKADPGTGKNFILERVLELVPKEDIIEFDRVTAQALFYADHLDLSAKVLVIQELVGGEDAMYSIRTLQEKGELRILVTVTKKGEEPQAHEAVVKGPCVVFSTTTKAQLDEDEETRTFSLALDASAEQTSNIIKAHASLFNSRILLPEGQKEKVRNVQRLVREVLEEKNLLGKPADDQVWAPWLEGLADIFPTGEVRFRRDFKRVASLVAAHALLHAPVRPDRDERGRVVANAVEDYAAVRELYNEIFRETASGLHPQSRLVLEAAHRILASKGADDAATVKRGEIAAELGWTEVKTHRWIKPLEGRYLHVEEGGRGKPYIYTEREGPAEVQLPTYEALKAAWFARLEVKEQGGEMGEGLG